VGFRLFTVDRASFEGLHGYVRNLADGRVEAVAEGDEEPVDRLERALRRGPPGAQVESFVVESVVPTGRAAGFSVRH
jgi:acylphosphatase